MIFLLAAGVAVSFVYEDLAPFIGYVGLVLGLFMGAAIMIRRTRGLSTRERRAWRSIALALCSLGLGVFLVGGLAGIGVTVPSFGLLDVFFIGGYFALVAGLYQLMRLDSGGREWVLTVVDSLVGGIALAALVWNGLFEDLMAAMSEARWWEGAIASLYPIMDVIIVVGVLMLVIRRSHYYLDLRLVFLAIGAGAQVLADLIFLGNGVGQSFDTAEPAWAMNMVATIFLLLAAAIVDHEPRKREFPEAPTPIWALIWPYLLAVSLFGVHFMNYRDIATGTSKILLLDAVIAIGAVIFLRQVYVIYRDRHRVDRKRAELVASVSHELRTPLTVMVGFLTLLDDNPDEFPVDARRDMISEATDQARHMARLVSDLLMLAKGDTSTLSLEIQEVRAMSIVNSVLRNTEASGVTIDHELDADVTVRVDPDRIEQALANLLTNAVRYGGDRCLVVAKVEGRDLIFEIHDSGDGVPTRFESMIWEHFERGAHRLDATTPGLGIGLSIVQAVTESHGGRAEYRVSERLGGACFYLTIPGCVVAEEPARRKVSADA